MKVKIRLDTMSDIKDFINALSAITDNVCLEDDDNHRVSAKSLMGVMYSFEWDNIYCYCDKDISGAIIKWII